MSITDMVSIGICKNTYLVYASFISGIQESILLIPYVKEMNFLFPAPQNLDGKKQLLNRKQESIDEKRYEMEIDSCEDVTESSR